MSEKSESDDFEDEDEPVAEESDDDLDQVIKDFDLAKQRRGGHKTGDPAWRRLERLLEEKQTAELTSDFTDYDIGDGHGPGKPRRKKKG